MVTPHEPRQRVGEPLKEGNMQEEQTVSGEPKTHTLTFQEAVELLGREYRAALVFLPDSPDQRGDAWSTLSIDEEGYAVEDFAPTWEETMSAALGVRVVARDEAAELRAAAEAWGDAHRHFRYVLAHPDQGSSEPYLWAEHEFYQAEERLRAALEAEAAQ